MNVPACTLLIEPFPSTLNSYIFPTAEELKQTLPLAIRNRGDFQVDFYFLLNIETELHEHKINKTKLFF